MKRAKKEKRKPLGKPLPPAPDEEFSPDALAAAAVAARQHASEYAPAEFNAMLDADSQLLKEAQEAAQEDTGDNARA
jgi:hypothetical protein